MKRRAADDGIVNTTKAPMANPASPSIRGYMSTISMRSTFGNNGQRNHSNKRPRKGCLSLVPWFVFLARRRRASCSMP
jgi:hypothetical protein